MWKDGNISTELTTRDKRHKADVSSCPTKRIQHWNPIITAVTMTSTFTTVIWTESFSPVFYCTQPVCSVKYSYHNQACYSLTNTKPVKKVSNSRGDVRGLEGGWREEGERMRGAVSSGVGVTVDPLVPVCRWRGVLKDFMCRIDKIRKYFPLLILHRGNTMKHTTMKVLEWSQLASRYQLNLALTTSYKRPNNNNNNNKTNNKNKNKTNNKIIIKQ